MPIGKLLVLALLVAFVGMRTTGASAQSEPEPLTTFEQAEFVLADQKTPPGDEAAWMPVVLPHDWRTLAEKGRVTGWYRIRLGLAKVPPEGRAVFLRHLRSSTLEVHVNGVKIVSSRDIYGPGAQDYGFTFHTLVSAPLWRIGANDLHFRMEASSLERNLHGLGRVHVGNPRAIRTLETRANNLTSRSLQMAFAAALAVGLIVLLLWLARRSDRVMFWFGVACLSWALASVPNFYFRAVTPPWMLDIANMYVRFGMAVPTFIVALRLVERRVPRLEAALGFFLCVEVTYFIWAPAWAPAVAAHWVARVFWPTASALLLFAGVAVIARFAPRPLRWSHWMEMLALAAMGGFLLQDLARYVGWADLEPPIVRHYHIPVMIAALGAVIFERHVAALWRIERSNEDLQRLIAEKAREIEDNHERIRQAEREHVLARERQRILMDMHDGLGASLVTLLRQVQSGSIDRPAIENRVQEALREMRIAIDALQPESADLESLLGNLRYRLDDAIRAAGVALVWEVDELPSAADLHPSVVFALQRIVLEAITNALKHAGAKTIRLAARACSESEVEIVIEDDGSGYDAQRKNGGIGLTTMRARADQIGASLTVGSRPGGGTTLRILVPTRQLAAAVVVVRAPSTARTVVGL